MKRKPWLLVLMLSSILCSTSCMLRIHWLSNPNRPSARIPESFDRCVDRPLDYCPSDSALLGSDPETLWRWVDRQLPDTLRLGQGKRIALMPRTSPGVAMQATLTSGQVSFILIQSHATSASKAVPLTRDSIVRFLDDATGCDTYRICQARNTIDEIRYRGNTTCEGAEVPLQFITPRYNSEVISVAVWSPAFTQYADSL